MSGSESFLSRWSRRKAESAERREISPAGPAPPAGEAKPDGREATPAALPETSEPAAQAFDPASLPSIESIAAGADIRPFLQSGAPEELTRAALRRAWATDPAIRDFIGIAENQWDFNDPTAIPGFGPLRAGDEAAVLAVLARAGDRFAEIAQASISAPPAPPEADSALGGEPVDKLRQTPAPSARGPEETETAGFAREPEKGNIAGGQEGALEEGGARRNHRSHGGAMPQ